MSQETNKIEPDATIRIPENIKIQVVPPQSEEQPEKGKNGHTDSTIIKSILDYIFSKEDQQEYDDLSIQSDPSTDFRRGLESSGKKYKLEKLIASGGFGRIFLAKDLILGRKAIVKTLKNEFLQDEQVIEHFISEAKLNSQLDHPGIVPLFSLDTDINDGLHLAMQRINGITLKEYLKRCRELQLQKHFSQKIYNMMLKERLETFLHICDTISYCHDRGVLHNDLKPENIMIGRYGQVYVMDWGIASIIDAPKPEQNAGSPAYMAPERICSRVLTKQTDIFALGMILNELVTLRPPVDGATISGILERICTGQFEPSCSIDPKRHIPTTLRAIIEKGRDPNPQKRYASVQVLANDIRHFLHNEETQAYPDSLFQKIFRFLFHNRNYAILLAACTVLLFFAIIGYNFYNASLITQKANQETLWKLGLVKSVDRKSDAIGKKLLLIQEQTANMGAALAIEYGKKIYDTNAPFYWNEDFAPRPKRRPPGLIHTVAYKGVSITLSTGTFYRFKDNLSQQEIQDWANNFRAQQSQHLANVLSHIHKNGNTYKTDKLKLFYEHGSMAQRIICVLDNGLAYCYPGKYEQVSSPNAFIPEYVRRELRSGKEIVWSSPYLDQSSKSIVVSCWHTISSLRGNKIGVIGMVILYEDILSDFLLQTEQDNDHEIYTLIDSDTRIICSTDYKFNFLQNNRKSAEESMIGQKSYKWYSEVIRRIRNHPMQNQFKAVLNGKPYNITWKRISSSNWLLIQHIPLDNRP